MMGVTEEDTQGLTSSLGQIIVVEKGTKQTQTVTVDMSVVVRYGVNAVTKVDAF